MDAIPSPSDGWTPGSDRSAPRPELAAPGRRSAVASAGAAVGAVLSASLAVLLVRLALSVADGLGSERLATALTAISAGACALVAARLALCLLATAIATALPGRGRRCGRRVALALSPQAARPLVALLLSAELGAGSAAAAATPSMTSASTVRPASVSVTYGDGRGHVPAVPLPEPAWSGLPEPGWIAPPPPSAPLPAPPDASLVTSGAGRTGAAPARAGHTADDMVVVRRGDSLWRIAARHLGAGASDAEVAMEWPRWWDANRQVVGSDPNVLLPGTRLRPPPRADRHHHIDRRHHTDRHHHTDPHHTGPTHHDSPNTQLNDNHSPKELR